MQKKQRKQNWSTYLRWCYDCNVPLLRKKCDICGDKGRAISLAGNGEVRPALDTDHSQIIELISKNYGPKAIKQIRNKAIYLAKSSGIDRVDEIIVDGIKIGTLEFDITHKIFKFIPTIEGCSIFAKHTQKIINVKKTQKGHLKGKYINSDSIHIPKNMDFEINDYAILQFSEGMIGKGLIKKDLSENENVIKIIDITRDKTELLKTKSNIEKALIANKGGLIILENEAKQFIKDTIKTNDKPINLAFSGGKDSLVVLELIRKTIPKYEIIYIDTGLEFKETNDYIKMMQKSLRTKIRMLKSKKDFYAETKIFGPPAKDYRWCCKTHKLAPIARYVSSTHPDGCLTFEGKRKNESFARSMSKRIDNNPFVPGQTSAYPILSWHALDIWFFILSKKLKYNPLYDLGFERVGCWMCPAGLQSELQKMKELEITKYQKFNEMLINWAESKMLSKRYISFGLWKWKELPKKMLKLAEEKKINLIPQNNKNEYSISSVSGIVPCHDKKFSIEGVFYGINDFERLENVLNVLGTVNYSKELGALKIKAKYSDISIFASGHIVIKSNTERDAKDMFLEVIKTIIRFETCNLCEICIQRCEKGAISIINNKITIDKKLCTHCRKCNSSCQTYTYANKVVDLSNIK